MNIFDWIKGTPKVVDNIFDKDKGLLTQVGQWIGGQQLTDQEKVEINKKIAKDVQAFAVATMKESTGRSQTRRHLATEWFDMHIFLLKITALCVPVDWLIIHYTEATTSELFNTFTAIVFDGWLCSITGGIGLFFWGTHSLRSSKFGADK